MYICIEEEKFERIDITMVTVTTFGWWDLAYHYYFCTYKRKEIFLKKCKGRSWGTLGHPGVHTAGCCEESKRWSFSHVRGLVTPGSSVHGILLQGIFLTWGSGLHCSGFFTIWATREAPAFIPSPLLCKYLPLLRPEKEYFPSVPCNDEWPCDTVPVIR